MRYLLILLLFICTTVSAQELQGEVTGEYPINLYKYPDDQSQVLEWLTTGDPLVLLGIYDEGGWYYVRVVNTMTQGWLPDAAVTTTADITQLAIMPLLPEDILYNVEYWNFTPAMNPVFLLGQELGNRVDAFSKVGDSITISRAFLTPIAYGVYQLDDDHIYLQSVIDFFNRDENHPTTSFLDSSRAAGTGWTSRKLLEQETSPQCARGDNRLQCEYRLTKPASALIMIGTNDVVSVDVNSYMENMRQIVEISLDMGVIPVLSTIPPMRDYEEKVEEFNLAIITVAEEYDVPIWNYWLALQDLPGEGLSLDGIHPSSPLDNAGTTLFTEENLEYGYTVRNLMALEVLYLLLVEVMYI
jgi:hypothetical protein